MISLIITNYNTWDLTTRCVNSVAVANAEKYIEEIIIIDDCSNQQAPESLTSNPKVRLIKNATNLGYAKSVNVGFAHAQNEICLLLDSDAYLISGVGCLPLIFEEKKDLGLLGMLLVDEQGKATGRQENEVSLWSILLGQQIHAKLGKLLMHKSKPISLYSCGIAVRKKAFEAVGGFDESFDFLEADHDFSMKINRSKWKIAIDDGIIIYHKGGGSFQLSSKRVIRFYQNRIKLLRKYNKLPLEGLVKFLIKIRLHLELLIIKGARKDRFDADRLEDKIYSRNFIIKHIHKF